MSDITEVVLEDQGLGDEKGLFVEYGELGTLKSVEVEYGGVEYEVDGDDKGAKEVLYGALRYEEVDWADDLG